jgi:hypothetical protein
VVGGQHATVPAPEDRLELAELAGLEARRRLQSLAERQELDRRHRLDHVELRDDELEDRQEALEGRERARGVAGFERLLQVAELVDQLLEPELVDLVDDDEEDLVVLVRLRPLRTEDLLQREVRRVRQRLVLAHPASLNSSRAMISRWTSDAPS